MPFSQCLFIIFKLEKTLQFRTPLTLGNPRRQSSVGFSIDDGNNIEKMPCLTLYFIFFRKTVMQDEFYN